MTEMELQVRMLADGSDNGFWFVGRGGNGGFGGLFILPIKSVREYVNSCGRH